MYSQKFKDILERALSGCNEDIEILLKLYEPLINKNSFLYGKWDEDLRQFILMRIVQSLANFSI